MCVMNASLKGVNYNIIMVCLTALSLRGIQWAIALLHIILYSMHSCKSFCYTGSTYVPSRCPSDETPGPEEQGPTGKQLRKQNKKWQKKYQPKEIQCKCDSDTRSSLGNGIHVEPLDYKRVNKCDCIF